MYNPRQVLEQISKGNVTFNVISRALYGKQSRVKLGKVYIIFVLPMIIVLKSERLFAR